jgi:hypothetical protein
MAVPVLAANVSFINFNDAYKLTEVGIDAFMHDIEPFASSQSNFSCKYG